MSDNQNKVLQTLNPNKIWIPLFIGLVVTTYFAFQIDFEQVKAYLLNANWIWFALAFLVLLARDTGYVYRIRTLTSEKLNWKASIYVILLWEFSSAVTPSVVGGTAVAVFIMNKEGINFGESMAYAMLTAMFDNLFFLILAPIGIGLTLYFGREAFPVFEVQTAWINDAFSDYAMQGTFLISYLLIAIYTSVFVYGLFINPRGLKWMLVKITSIRLLRRWRKGTIKTGNDIILASKMLRGHDFSYWSKITFSTFFIWVARYFMLNCLIAAFVGLDLLDHLVVFSRQIVMWIVMLISPTPGSSGTAEIVFSSFYGEFLGSFSEAAALFWRGFYYYPYLIIGVIILPRWLRRIADKDKKAKEVENEVVTKS
jgi:uncharacterized protein (TIRG00374 family)